MKFYWFLAMLPLPAFAQQASVLTEYDAVQLFNAVADQTAKLAPMIEQINTAEWIAKGAAPTYTQLRDGAVAQNKAIVNAMHELVQHPTKLSECLSALFHPINGDGTHLTGPGFTEVPKPCARGPHQQHSGRG